MTREEPRSIRFELVDPARNARRYYVVLVTPGLFVRNTLTITRGRIGANAVTRVEEFMTEAQLARRWRELVGRRRRHGYRETS